MLLIFRISASCYWLLAFAAGNMLEAPFSLSYSLFFVSYSLFKFSYLLLVMYFVYFSKEKSHPLY